MKRISGDKVIYAFAHDIKEIETVKPRVPFKVETNDCFFQQIYEESQVLNEIDYDRLNPATGPIFVEGAEVGDMLVVKILDVAPIDKGVAAVVIGEGAAGDQVKKSIVQVIDVVDNKAIYEGVEIPLDPMIGVIGVAPKEEDGRWQTNSPWKHGGNMDTKEIVKGTTLYFEVNQPGGLLALGDCHAVMGDGEVCFTGLEIPAVVTLEVDIIKDRQATWPILERENEIVFIASGDTLEDAAYEATKMAVDNIAKVRNIEWEKAYIIASMAMDLRISQVVNPKKTVRAAISKDILTIEAIFK